MFRSGRRLALCVLLATGCTVGEETEHVSEPWLPWDGPSCDGHEIDGQFGGLDDDYCQEWTVEPIRGRFGDLYLDVDRDSNLVVLNDWHLRDDAPADADMFNLFCLATDLGFFEIRVFGDQHVEAWLDGEPVDDIEGASGFGASPLTETPHSIFEFRLARLPTTVTILEKDPAGGRRETPAIRPGVELASSGTCFPGSAPEIAHNLVEEPTIFRFELGPEGVRSATATTRPAIFGTDARLVESGAELTVYGSNLGDGGTVLFDGNPAVTRAWGDDEVRVVVPEIRGDVEVSLRVGASMSNPLRLDVRTAGCVPTCGECGSDGCGGTCGACVGGLLCDEALRACVPEELM